MKPCVSASLRKTVHSNTPEWHGRPGVQCVLCVACHGLCVVCIECVPRSPACCTCRSAGSPA